MMTRSAEAHFKAIIIKTWVQQCPWLTRPEVGGMRYE